VVLFQYSNPFVSLQWARHEQRMTREVLTCDGKAMIQISTIRMLLSG